MREKRCLLDTALQGEIYVARCWCATIGCNNRLGKPIRSFGMIRASGSNFGLSVDKLKMRIDIYKLSGVRKA